MGTMTKLPGVPEKETAVPGMAYFAGTGPAGKTCLSCQFHGMWREARSGKNYHYPGCSKFRALTGRYGPAVSSENRACKYFEHD